MANLHDNMKTNMAAIVNKDYWRTRLVIANQVKMKYETHFRLSPLWVHNNDLGAALHTLLIKQ